MPTTFQDDTNQAVAELKKVKNLASWCQYLKEILALNPQFTTSEQDTLTFFTVAGHRAKVQGKPRAYLAMPPGLTSLGRLAIECWQHAWDLSTVDPQISAATSTTARGDALAQRRKGPAKASG